MTAAVLIAFDELVCIRGIFGSLSWPYTVVGVTLPYIRVIWTVGVGTFA